MLWVVLGCFGVIVGFSGGLLGCFKRLLAVLGGCWLFWVVVRLFWVVVGCPVCLLGCF